MINLRIIEAGMPPTGIDDRVRRLRTNSLKEWREGRDAALFAYGLETQVMGVPIFVAKTEAMDFDFLSTWFKDGAQHFCPVQIKELPPADLNAKVTIDDIYDKLERYSGPDNLTVAIRLSRTGRFTFEPRPRQRKLNISGLWFFGCCSPDQSRWFLRGDILHPTEAHYEFAYPTGGWANSRVEFRLG